jgi:hypothetical protein
MIYHLINRVFYAIRDNKTYQSFLFNSSPTKNAPTEAEAFERFLVYFINVELSLF